MKIVFLVANEGVEQAELQDPWAAIEKAGAQPVLIAPETGSNQAFNHLDKGDTFNVDLAVADASVEDYAGLANAGATWVDEQVHGDSQGRAH